MTSRFLPIAARGHRARGPFCACSCRQCRPRADGRRLGTNNRDLLARRLRVRLRLPHRTGAERALRSAVRHRLERRAPRLLRAGERRRDATRRASFRRLSLSHEGLRSTFDLDAEAEIIKPRTPIVRIGALRLSAAGEYGLDEVTNFATDGVSRPQPGGAVRSQQPGRNLDQPAYPRWRFRRRR